MMIMMMMMLMLLGVDGDKAKGNEFFFQPFFTFSLSSKLWLTLKYLKVGKKLPIEGE